MSIFFFANARAYSFETWTSLRVQRGHTRRAESDYNDPAHLGTILLEHCELPRA
jgi:hypothetical protein